MKSVVSTGQIADICGVATRTVSKWIDSGRLTGFRIPGGNDRRVAREELERFLEQHNMPTERFKEAIKDGTYKSFFAKSEKPDVPLKVWKTAILTGSPWMVDFEGDVVSGIKPRERNNMPEPVPQGALQVVRALGG